jgi:hypothetical protein
MEKAVEHGARIFDSVEPNLEKAHDRLLKIVAVIDAGHSLGMMGALAKGRLRGQAQAAAGKIAEAIEATYRLHRELTDIAIAHNVDIPTTRDGGGR